MIQESKVKQHIKLSAYTCILVYKTVLSQQSQLDWEETLMTRALQTRLFRNIPQMPP